MTVKFWGHVPPISHLPSESAIQGAWKETVGGSVCVPELFQGM